MAVVGRASKNYPRELRERAIAMVREVRPDYPSEHAAIEMVADAGAVIAAHCGAHHYTDPGKPKIAWDDVAARTRAGSAAR
jgi:hypothetical protein